MKLFSSHKRCFDFQWPLTSCYFNCCRRVKGQKMTQNGNKFFLFPYLGNRTSLDCGFQYTCIKWLYLQQFFIFPKFWFFGFLGRRGQKMTHNYQFQSVTLYISGTVDHTIKIFDILVNKQIFWEILRCVSPFSHVCDFFIIAWLGWAKAYIWKQ